MNVLYVFLDESGNLDFSRTGTTHYVLAAVTTISPLTSSQDLQQLKYHLLEEGTDIESFHASEDKQTVRNEVLDKINNMSPRIRAHYIYAKKPKAHPSLHNSADFYSKLGTILMRYIMRYRTNGYDKVIIIFDKCLVNKDQKAFLGKIKPELKSLGKPYQIYFHKTLSDFNGQIADYFAWSKYVSLERAENRPLEALSGIPKTQFDIFSRGTREWY